MIRSNSIIKSYESQLKVEKHLKRKNIKLGLKLWSTNRSYIREAISLFEEGTYQYIELYVVPETYREFIMYWKKLRIPYIIHAPHSSHGLDLSDRSKLNTNCTLVEEALRYADNLKANNIILHPGINGTIDENINQLNVIRDKRIIIENMPYFTMDKLGFCNGNSPYEIQSIIESCNIGFCFDIGHSIYAANALNVDSMEYIDTFIKLNPKMYHLSDGDQKGIADRHMNLLEGTFNLPKILDKIYSESFVTMETPKKSNNSLNDFIKDTSILNNIL